MKSVLLVSLILVLTGCEVDYGHVQWMYVDDSLGDEDGEWWYTIKRAAKMWSDATDGEGHIQFTKDRKSTPHTIRMITMEECESPLSGPGTYLFNFEDSFCAGKAYFNIPVNTWTVGLNINMFTDPEYQSRVNYYSRLGLVLHELGHVLGCSHVDAPYAIMYKDMEFRPTLESTTLTYDDLTEFYDSQDNLYPQIAD